MTKLYLKPRFIATFLTIFSSYLAFVTFLMNWDLVTETLNGSFSVSYKFRLIMSLLEGIWTSMAGWSLFLLIATAFLIGINVSLLFQQWPTMKDLKVQNTITAAGSFLGVIGSGCATCGLPILPLVGLTGLVAYLPLRGVEFSYLSIVVLVLSTYFLIKNQNRQCSVPAVKGYKQGW